jgi:hypothetical protein
MKIARKLGLPCLGLSHGSQKQQLSGVLMRNGKEKGAINNHLEWLRRWCELAT